MPFCGNCKSHHANAAAVRSCYQGRQTTTASSDYDDMPQRPMAGRQTTTVFAKTHVRSLGAEGTTGRATLPVDFRPATEKQINFMVDLAGQIATASGATLDATLTEPALRESVARGHLSKSKAHETIDSMLALLGRIKAEQPAPAVKVEESPVPSGRYAIVSEPGDDGKQVIKFYKVDVVTEGRWAGNTYLSVQASDELHRIRNATARSAILGAIARDVRGAMALYGQELGKCGMCGRTLTDELSRELGIGPVCREKF